MVKLNCSKGLICRSFTMALDLGFRFFKFAEICCNALYHANTRQFKKKPCEALIFVLFFTIMACEKTIMRRFAVSAVCVLLFSASPAWADFYRYVDRDGREFFTNDLKQIPQEYRSGATLVKPDTSRVNTAGEPSSPGNQRVTNKEHKDKYGRGEAHWRNKAGKLRLKLRREQDQYDLAMKQLSDLDQAPKTSGGKKKSRSGLVKQKAKLELKMAQTKRELEVTLPEEARKADAYPGWIRE
jgi:hypothetical protein